MVGRLTTLYKPRLWWLEGGGEGEGREGKASEEARVGMGCRARQYKSRQELKKRKGTQEKEEVKVVYLKRLFVNKRS